MKNKVNKVTESSTMKREADRSDQTFNRSMFLKKGKKFQSQKQLAFQKEKAEWSLLLQSDPVLPLVQGFKNVTTTMPLLFTWHEVVMDSKNGYFVCKPCIPKPQYVFNECVTSFHHGDYCTAKVTVLDATTTMPVKYEDLMVDFVEKVARMTLEDDVM